MRHTIPHREPSFSIVYRALLLPFAVCAATLLVSAQALAGLGLPENIVVESAQSNNDFPVVAGGVTAPLWYDASDWDGVQIAITNLQADVERVTSVLPALSTASTASPPSSLPIIVGTLGKSAAIDALVATGKLDDSSLAGKWESFVIRTVNRPFPGVDQALVIAGSDKRGTIYGIYELSEQLGVSPWYWWADVPPKTKAEAYVAAGSYASGEPAVKYRGIFLNDEAPALTGWSNATFGGRNSAFYETVFELLLRLRGNYLWPAMWGDAFNLDDPMNPVLADRYGVVMGTSHHEPVMRNQQEWSRNKSSYGSDWDYLTNSNGLQAFWADGMNNVKSYENIVTIGMRGDGDEAMDPDGTIADNVALLERIVDDQRGIITNVTGKAIEDVPQVWTLYKEVMDYYDHGMRVPDDVTLLWADDNWGNIRRLPTDTERGRAGGAGVYYHFDYVGGPRSYMWLNTNPLPKIHEQMSQAYAYGADRIWIVNVGDLKPMEVPMEFFLRMAWDPDRWGADELDEYLVEWAGREFGPAHAVEAADLVAKYAKYNGRRKPELLEPDTFSVMNEREADRVLEDWLDLDARATTLSAHLPADTRDAFYQLVQFPIKACANVNNLYITTAYNRLYAGQQRASVNALKAEAEALFQGDADLTTHWNTTFAGGKWIHMMDQTHIGYTSWNSPSENIIPSLSTYSAPASVKVGVALEGSDYVLASGASATLPLLSSEGGAESRYIDVFRQGTLSASYAVEANHPWIEIAPAAGSLADDVRVEVSIDWTRAPIGRGDVLLTVNGSDGSERTIVLPIRKAAPAPVDAPVGFLDIEGFVAIEAPNFDRAVETNGISWTVLPNYGRTQGGVTPYPLLTDSIEAPGADTPRIEYDVYLNTAGPVGINLVTAPSLNVNPDRGLRCAVAFDGQVPVIIDVGGTADAGDWADSVRDAARMRSLFLDIEEPGAHTLKVWMVDPGFVLQRVEIDTGGLPDTYLGPQESPRGKRGDTTLYEEDQDEAKRDAVVVQAESGAVGGEFSIVSGAPSYITVDATSTATPTSARIASCDVTFAEPGTYRLFARIRVGSEGYSDDSLFVRSGFGDSASWITVNGLAGVGFMNSEDVVSPSSDNGSTGSQVWKWVDLSALGNTTFTVPSGALTQTIQIAGREDGLDIDKLVFGLDGDSFTVGSLNLGYGLRVAASIELTLEAESSAYGIDFSHTGGMPSYISIEGTAMAPPFASTRVARFQAGFAAAGTYRLYARVRVGSDGYDDDSLFLGNGFGAKDPAASGDWITINGLAGLGYSSGTNLVDPSDSGSAGTQVWKWIDLSSLSGLGEFVVSEGALTQTLDLAGREDGLDIDKLFFGWAGRVYTVAELDAGTGGSVPTATEVSPILTVDIADLRQEIDGFGASSAWVTQNISDEWADLFFSTSGNGIGLSLLRLRITPEGTTWETATAQKAIARGAKVWATPWSPPGEWKSNSAVTNGGTLLPEYRDDWAQRLSDFVVNMNNAGVALEAISAQNEPNYTADWESCRWTPEEMTAFIRDYLGPALAANGLPTRVLAGETIGWQDMDDYGDILLGDASARSYISHIGTHTYGSSEPFPYTTPADNGVRLWETEHTDHGGADSDLTMASGLRVGNDIHDALTIAEVNAWHYWWLRSADNTVGALMENGVLAKRGYVMGNWSRFVRPGFQRVELYGSMDTLRATAFVSPDKRQLAVVVVNSDDSEHVVPMSIEDGLVGMLTPWETSDLHSLESGDPVTAASDGSFELSVPAGSVVTFVSDALNDAPTAIELDGSMIHENLASGTVVGSLSALDANAGESFIYSLVTGNGSTHNSEFSVVGNELRTSVPLDFEAESSRSVRIRVTDSLGGTYEQALTITIVNDTAEYADWSAVLPVGLRAVDFDGNGDGIPNLWAYALGYTANDAVPSNPTGLAAEDSAGILLVTFLLPADAPEDVRYSIESADDLSSTWSIDATRDGIGIWTGSTLPSEEAAPDNRTRVMLEVVVQGQAFYRLAVEPLNPGQ